jgi:hypothetical protein
MFYHLIPLVKTNPSPRLLPLAALTIATIPAFTASGRSAHASTTACKSDVAAAPPVAGHRQR